MTVLIASFTESRKGQEKNYLCYHKVCNLLYVNTKIEIQFFLSTGEPYMYQKLKGSHVQKPVIKYLNTLGSNRSD